MVKYNKYYLVAVNLPSLTAIERGGAKSPAPFFSLDTS